MLQQTQVQTVLPYYHHFIRRFPSLQALAEASEAEVLNCWAGLGYYSRARNLKQAASMILQEHRGIFPDKREDILRLPGVGPYIAGAVLSIAFNRAEPVVDGNVRRVISRLHGLTGKAPDAFFWQQAAAWIAPDSPADFNQAVMELGALVCVPSQPRCRDCPIVALCAARRRGIENRIPLPRRPDRPQHIRAAVLLLVRRGRVLLIAKSAPDFIPGEWGFPLRVLDGCAAPEAAARSLARELLGGAVKMQPLAPLKHGITFRRIIAYPFLARAGTAACRFEETASRLWCPVSDLDRWLLSSFFRKLSRYLP